MQSFKNYSGLVAEFYDLWFAHQPTKDLVTYKHYLQALPGPALEIGSGTGRLLLPLLQEGFEVEGVEPSAPMRAICSQKAQALNLTPIVYTQIMQELILTKLYTTIFIPFATIMVILDRKDAQNAFTRIYQHLVPGGQLLISTYLPFIKSQESTEKNWRLRRKAIRKSDNALVICHEINTYDLIEQIKYGFYKYEIFKDGTLLATHHDEQHFRWYTKYELMLMLEKSGFSLAEATTHYQEQEVPYDHTPLFVRALK